MPFLTEAVPVSIDKLGIAELLETVVYRGNPEHGGDEIVVPVGFKTDMASVPRFLTWLTPVAGAHNRAAILHDLNCVELARAYSEAQEWRGIPAPWLVPAKINAVDTDGMFLRCLRELGMRPYRRRAYWVGVRYGAAANKARREGWWSTFPMVALWTLLLLPIVPAALTTALTLGIGRLLGGIYDQVLRLFGRGRPLPVIQAANARRNFAARRKP